MLARVDGKSAQNEAVKALMRIRMRCSAFCDFNYWWQNPHPDNPRLNTDSQKRWLDDQWKLVDLRACQAALVDPADWERWDREICTYQLWLCPQWPVDDIVGKRIRDDGTFNSHENWIARLWESIQKHGIKDPILAIGHEDFTTTGYPRGTPNTVLGNNRIAVARHYGLKTIPAVVSLKKGVTPKYDGEAISFERYHDEIMGFRADMWVTPAEFYLIHPPTVFYDEKDGGTHKPSPV